MNGNTGNVNGFSPSLSGNNWIGGCDAKPVRERGFTLIEVLAALVILGMILTVVGTMLITTLRTQRSIDASFRRHNHGTAILNLISEDLRDAFSPEPHNEKRRYFYGKNQGTSGSSQDQLDFVTSQDAPVTDEGISADYSECGYLLKPNPSETGVYRMYRRSSPWIEGNPVRGGTLTLLHSQVVSLNFEYLKTGDATEGVDSEWLDQWDDQRHSGRLPQRVRITLVLQLASDTERQDRQARQRTFSTVVSLTR